MGARQKKKTLSGLGSVTDRQKYEYCQACRKAKADPPCRTCEYQHPELMPENFEAWELWIESRHSGAAAAWDYRAGL